MRRATSYILNGGRGSTISIHALREEGDVDTLRFSRRDVISIHALREEGDRGHSYYRCRVDDFYPRPP